MCGYLIAGRWQASVRRLVNTMSASSPPYSLVLPPGPEARHSLRGGLRLELGETGTTDRQSWEPDRKVIDVTGSKLPPQQNRPDTESESNGLEDAISDPQSD